MKKSKLFLTLTVLLFFQCKRESNYLPITINSDFIKKIKMKENQLFSWHFKDIIDDSIPGISLEKAYKTILKDRKGKEVIVAIIDMPIDINHEDLNKNIWVNKNEIPANNIDDDKNGYIDDINGWNFLGNAIGENSMFVNYEYTRILKKYKNSIKNETHISITDSDSTLIKAKSMYEVKMNFAIEDTAYINMVQNAQQTAKSTINNYFNTEKLNSRILDSLKSLSANDSIIQMEIVKMTNFLKYGYTDEFIDDYKLKAYERFNKLLNLDYDDRFIRGDDQENINDINYGNNKVNANVGFFNHGTLMAGIIGAERHNNLGIDGFSNNIKIMPIAISAYGDEHDKDISLAIRYAVDNGAKVINMSFGKEFSLHKEWVLDAIKYADQNNVLIVRAAGNSGYNLNKINYSYPNDRLDNGKEVSDNFILVGASSYKLTEELLSSLSNYGNDNVDVFAPEGGFITTSAKQDKYEITSPGTSNASAIVSGLSALIFSYYPNLSASQVKHIIMDSGVEYKIMVNLPYQKDEKKMPFNKLSKSGKIVNAYNAMIMAEKLSNN